MAIAPSSRKTYSASERRYLQFCQQHNLDALPGTDTVLSYYAAYLTRTLRPSSVHVYMAAIRNLHHELGLEFPAGPTTLLARVMRGIARLPEASRTRLPITMSILCQLCHRLTLSRLRPAHDSAVLKAEFSMAFHGFFRCGELTGGLRRSDIRIREDGILEIFLRSSKTDPTGRGITVEVGTSTNEAVCPVVLVQQYCHLCGDAPGPLFLFQSGASLTRHDVTHHLRTLLSACGVPSAMDYSSHSFRIGAATTAAIAGVPDHLIRHMGRWRSDSVLRYTRVDSSEVMGISNLMATVQ